jgi:hypothetical protein
MHCDSLPAHHDPLLLDDYEIQQILNANSSGLNWKKQPASIFDPASVVQHVWKRDDGATATIQGAFITVESPAAEKFKKTEAQEEIQQRHREEPRF